MRHHLLYCTCGRQHQASGQTDSQNNWIRGVLLPHQAWRVIAEGRTTYDSKMSQSWLIKALSLGPTLIV